MSALDRFVSYDLLSLHLSCAPDHDKRIWCSGIIVPSHGTDRGSIPRMRSSKKFLPADAFGLGIASPFIPLPSLFSFLGNGLQCL